MDLPSFTDAELCAAIDAIAYDIAAIKTQINQAKSIAASTGDYSDAYWFQQANAALRYKGIEHQSMLQEQGKRSRAKKKAQANNFERAFVQAARQVLDANTFRVIMDAAFIKSNKGATE